jgi:asparaginyl-tRNA synthetase
MQKRRYKVDEIHKLDKLVDNITVFGWIKTTRDNKNIGFIELNDGSSFNNIQIILDSTNEKLTNFSEAIKFKTGASIKVSGKLVESPAKGQKYEIIADEVVLLGDSKEDYPLQKKRHTLEFLRSIPHIRPRANLYQAAFRVRNKLSYAIHNFFQSKGFLYLHSPIITASDCEGAGELFRVTTLDLENIERTKENKIDYSKDFFGKQSYLTVSGQLQGEIFAMAFSDIYTFGPTFRAENSNTSRHLAEFWMIEPEMAFCDLKGDIEMAEEFIKYITKYVLEHCYDDILFFDQRVEKGLIDRLKNLIDNKFEVLEYTEAIKILEKATKKFEFPVKWGIDLQSEHEKYLTEEVFKKPVFVCNYPKEIKAFYMKLNDDDKTVAAVDLLVPKIGEIIGGSQREDRYDVLVDKMKSSNINPDDMKWYLDLRLYGGCEHAGFGLGFERAIQYITGIENIKDVIPFPRTPKNADI